MEFIKEDEDGRVVEEGGWGYQEGKIREKGQSRIMNMSKQFLDYNPLSSEILKIEKNW